MRDAGEYQCQAATSTGTITLSTVLHVANPQEKTQLKKFKFLF